MSVVVGFVEKAFTMTEVMRLTAGIACLSVCRIQHLVRH